jgi:hypothetical protein
MTFRYKFENEGEPIDNVDVALDLLKPWRGDFSTRELIKGRRAKETGPWIEVGHHHDFSDSSWERYLVSDAVVHELVGFMWVDGKRHWGWTDENVLSISEAGEHRIWERRKALGVPHFTRLYGWGPTP